MAQRFYRVIASIPFDDFAATSVSVNTWHFRTNGSDTQVNDAAAIRGTLQTFYTAVDQLYSQNVSTTIRFRVYNLEDGEPRSTIDDTTSAFSAGGSIGLPNEVAMCLSFRGALTSGVNRLRNRGRVFLGPLDSSVAVSATGDVQITSAVRTTVTTAANAMKGPISFGAGGGIHDWCVFSRAEAGAPANALDAYSNAQLVPAFRPVAAGYVDNAFDTQRRRGLKTTARTTF